LPKEQLLYLILKCKYEGYFFTFQFDQTSLGLPTRDYFLQPSNMVYLEAYKNYFIKISTLLGAPLDNVTQEAETLINFETRLAEVRY
jgi:predicted metalloendopeptidase